MCKYKGEGKVELLCLNGGEMDPSHPLGSPCRSAPLWPHLALKDPEEHGLRIRSVTR